MISWKIKYYNQLSRDLLYLILKTRQQVFIIEQNCNYLDADDLDQYSYHLMGFKENELVAYMRIVDAGHIYDYRSFGRILVKEDYRGLNIGRKLMKTALGEFVNPNSAIIMSAQSYLVKFYQEFAFEVVGDQYLEDNIPHVKMIRHG